MTSQGEECANIETPCDGGEEEVQKLPNGFWQGVLKETSDMKWVHESVGLFPSWKNTLSNNSTSEAVAPRGVL